MDRFPKQHHSSILVETFPLILNMPLFYTLTNLFHLIMIVLNCYLYMQTATKVMVTVAI